VRQEERKFSRGPLTKSKQDVTGGAMIWLLKNSIESYYDQTPKRNNEVEPIIFATFQHSPFNRPRRAGGSLSTSISELLHYGTVFWGNKVPAPNSKDKMWNSIVGTVFWGNEVPAPNSKAVQLNSTFYLNIPVPLSRPLDFMCSLAL